MAGTQGQSCIMTFLDMDCLGESQGPGAQPLLRKKYNVDPVLLRKLIQGSMLGRGSQKRDNGEATRVVDGDVIVIHDGFGHPGGQKEAKSMFRLTTARKESELDAETKEMIVIYEDASIRTRKQRVRGPYGCFTSLTLASSVPLSQCLPEKAFEFHPGHSTSNVFQGVKALAPADMWHESRRLLPSNNQNHISTEFKVLRSVAFDSLNRCIFNLAGPRSWKYSPMTGRCKSLRKQPRKLPELMPIPAWKRSFQHVCSLWTSSGI